MLVSSYTPQLGVQQFPVWAVFKLGLCYFIFVLLVCSAPISLDTSVWEAPSDACPLPSSRTPAVPCREHISFRNTWKTFTGSLQFTLPFRQDFHFLREIGDFWTSNGSKTVYVNCLSAICLSHRFTKPKISWQ